MGVIFGGEWADIFVVLRLGWGIACCQAQTLEC